jgi:acyl-homoserine lactone acylase PvdQ
MTMTFTRSLRLLALSSLLVCTGLAAAAAPDSPARDGAEQARWERQARAVVITRDDWGLAHVHGATDAGAVFGMVYAQAEDDYTRIERNYLFALGRTAEADGEDAIWQDLRARMYLPHDTLQQAYADSPAWLRRLMDAWAAGLNYYLATHPQVPRLAIARYEPWMALSFTEGSIGGDIERVPLRALAELYGADPQVALALPEPPDPLRTPTGSNGIAIAPSRTVDGNALLLINPHTSFFFRSEAHMVSEEGLNAYGALTWGQFFVYQGFNERAGWMHTSSGVDNIDEYLETVVKKNDRFYYRYGSEERPMTADTIVVPYKTASGMAQKTFTVYRTHHGPIVREANGKWVSVRLMEDPLKALTQSYTRTKAHDYKAFRKTMELHTNSSNNTIFADADGNIAYFHSNFIPRRDTTFDWSKPVDGSNPTTEWNGVLSIDETPGLLNPSSGWLYNSNNWPWSAAGASSPKRSAYPAYVERGTAESPRGVHAIRVLEGKHDFTLDSLIAAAYDSYLPAFAHQIPALLKAWDGLADANPLKAKLAEPVALLRGWDFRWSAKSTATALAVYWGEEIGRQVAADARNAGVPAEDYIVNKAAPERLLQALSTAADTLTSDFGSWKTPWGDINRFQRLTGDIVQPFNDAGPSIPVPFTSSRWGSLASFGARTYDGTKKMYGTSGNSFVAVVEFGDRVRAKAVSAGGESGDPSSRHFNDQAQRYAAGDLRDVYFYRADVEQHSERQYHPGQ